MTPSQQLAQFIANGLARQSVDKCSRWAEQYRIMGPPYPGPWSFAHHPWLRAMHDSKARRIIGQKAAQMGYTETALNLAFYTLDMEDANVLYLLPASIPDAKDFSTSRFDPALEASEHLREIFTEVANIHHKRSGNANLFVRGARSRSQVKSIPVKVLIADEVDEMPEANLVLAQERTTGQLNWQHFFISTPTAHNFGINAYFNHSTQNHWFFPCPHCGRQTELIFPECLVITAEEPHDKAVMDSHLICKECNFKLEHSQKSIFLNKGNWVPAHEDRLDEGFHISQLYSMTATPADLAIKYLHAATNPFDEQEFHNSKLGLTHEVSGARITDEIIDACICDFMMKEPDGDFYNRFVTMGIDVGKFLHYEITEWSIDPSASSTGMQDLALLSMAKVVRIGKCLNFSELDNLMRDYQVNYCVIDHQPETRAATEFANRFYGHVSLCHYDSGGASRQITEFPNEHRVNVHRTSWLDLSLSRFKNRTIRLPKDLPLEYRQNVSCLQRIYKKDKNENPVSVYVKPDSVPDHYAHAHNYNEIAFYLGQAKQANRDISTLVI